MMHGTMNVKVVFSVSFSQRLEESRHIESPHLGSAYGC